MYYKDVLISYFYPWAQLVWGNWDSVNIRCYLRKRLDCMDRQNNPTASPWTELHETFDQCCWIVNAFASGLHSYSGDVDRLSEWLNFNTSCFKITYNIKLWALRIFCPLPPVKGSPKSYCHLTKSRNHDQ